ncbi:unnamed protein product [Diamesa tonsa]
MKGGESKPLKIQEADKMNILCLHGYRQNSVSFKNKTGSLRKLLKNYANFTYLEAPHLAKAMEGEEQSEEQKSWWSNKNDGSFKGTNQCGPAYGFEESIKHVEKTWNEHGNFQGIMGFSQGACFVSLICSMSERSLTSIKPQFAIMSSGFLSGSLVHKNSYESQIKMPSLHISGSTDEIIPQEMSVLLENLFENPTIHHHTGGHFFPATKTEKEVYVDFFLNQLQKHLEDKELKNAVVIEDNDE